jgi:hypothetical protein
MKVTKTRAQPKFSDDPEVVHETSGISTTEQSRLPPDTSEALFDDDEETRAIQGEQTRLYERRSRLMELERLEDEERRLKRNWRIGGRI